MYTHCIAYHTRHSSTTQLAPDQILLYILPWHCSICWVSNSSTRYMYTHCIAYHTRHSSMTQLAPDQIRLHILPWHCSICWVSNSSTNILYCIASYKSCYYHMYTWHSSTTQLASPPTRLDLLTLSILPWHWSTTTSRSLQACTWGSSPGSPDNTCRK